jgi:hypothetical protein
VIKNGGRYWSGWVIVQRKGLSTEKRKNSSHRRLSTSLGASLYCTGPGLRFQVFSQQKKAGFLSGFS